jgi:4'-phosphopantetheinyl transferase
VDFNVSHQAGIVSLIAVVGAKGVTVGTDVVCVNERIQNDYKHIEKDGFFDWVDMHADVFAESEVNFMKLYPVDLDLNIPGAEIKGYGKDATSRCQWRNRKLEIKAVNGGNGRKMEVESNKVIDAKLRRFYAMWCLRETYVKMTGEALLAPWLKELEISNVRIPGPWPGFNEEGSLEEGDMVEELRILFKGKLVTNVKMELTALGKDFMVGGAIRLTTRVDKSDLAMGQWKELDLGTDVLAFGESIS